MNNARTIEVDGRSSIQALVFLEDGRHFLSGSDDGMIRQWRVEDGVEVQNQRFTVGGLVQAISLSSDRKWVVVSSGERSVTVWDRTTRQRVRTMDDHTDLVHTVDVSSDSTRFASGSRDRRVFIWDLFTGRRLVGPLQHNESVVAVKISPNGSQLAVAVYDTNLRVYDAANGQLLRSAVITTGLTNPISWSSDSQRIFTFTSGITPYRDNPL